MDATPPFWWRVLSSVPNNSLTITCVYICSNISTSTYVHAHGGFLEPVPRRVDVIDDLLSLHVTGDSASYFAPWDTCCPRGSVGTSTFADALPVAATDASPLSRLWKLPHRTNSVSLWLSRLPCGVEACSRRRSALPELIPQHFNILVQRFLSQMFCHQVGRVARPQHFGEFHDAAQLLLL